MHIPNLLKGANFEEYWWYFHTTVFKFCVRCIRRIGAIHLLASSIVILLVYTNFQEKRTLTSHFMTIIGIRSWTCITFWPIFSLTNLFVIWYLNFSANSGNFIKAKSFRSIYELKRIPSTILL